MGTIVVTGSAGGMGAALRRRLESRGDEVVGVDVRDAEVIADLATPAGRAAMVDSVAEQTGGEIDGLVVAAGITHDDGPTVVAINYFGAVATLTGLRPMFVGSGNASAVVLSSNSCSTQPGLPVELTRRLAWLATRTPRWPWRRMASAPTGPPSWRSPAGCAATPPPATGSGPASGSTGSRRASSPRR